MTIEQKQSIREMRQHGKSISQISDLLSLSINTIKSFCRRDALGACNTSIPTGEEKNKGVCPQCGKRLQQNPGSKPRIFCCNKCRYAWWNSHRQHSNRNAVHHFTCAHCRRAFVSYGSRSRKYCSHLCFTNDRFGGTA